MWSEKVRYSLRCHRLQDTTGRFRHYQIACLQHEIHVRQNLTERKARLMRIKGMMEEEGNEFRSRSGMIPTRFENHLAPLMMMLDKLIDPLM